MNVDDDHFEDVMIEPEPEKCLHSQKQAIFW